MPIFENQKQTKQYLIALQLTVLHCCVRIISVTGLNQPGRMSQHWHFPRVSIGTHDFVIHTFPPFPLIAMFILSFVQISILLFTLSIDLFQLLSSFPTIGGEYVYNVCSCVLSLLLATVSSGTH